MSELKQDFLNNLEERIKTLETNKHNSEYSQSLLPKYRLLDSEVKSESDLQLTESLRGKVKLVAEFLQKTLARTGLGRVATMTLTYEKNHNDQVAEKIDKLLGRIIFE